MIFLAALLLTATPDCPPAGPGSPGLAQLGWLAGAWSGDDRGTLNEEVWMAPSGGRMLAMHRDTAGGKATGFEFLRIEEDAGGLVYRAMPEGRPATDFRRVAQGPRLHRLREPRARFPAPHPLLARGGEPPCADRGHPAGKAHGHGVDLGRNVPLSLHLMHATVRAVLGPTRRTVLGSAGCIVAVASTGLWPGLASAAEALKKEDGSRPSVLGPRQGYTPLVGTLVSMLTWMRETVVLRTVKGMSTPDLDYLLDAKANSIGALLLHLAATETYYGLHTFDGMAWNTWPESTKKTWDAASNLGSRAREEINCLLYTSPSPRD